MSRYVPQLSSITKFGSWIVIIGSVIGLIYLGVVNGATLSYRPERIVERFVSLIENPTQTITDSEKAELEDITQSGFLRNWGNENNLKTLRRISQGNPVSYSELMYTGNSKRIATSILTFENDLTNEHSKEGKVYLERYGNIFVGIKWQIFQVDMPQEDNLLNDAQEISDDVSNGIQDRAQNVVDRVRDFFGE